MDFNWGGNNLVKISNVFCFFLVYLLAWVSKQSCATRIYRVVHTQAHKFIIRFL